MELHEYSTMRSLEDDYWWYVGLRDLLLALAGRHCDLSVPMRILDAGCGTGGTLSFLAKALPRSTLFGVDAEAVAVDLARSREAGTVVRASINELPFASAAFDLVVCLDVLYTKEVEEQRALGELTRVLRSAGLAVINVPAYEFLRGEHDLAIHTRHRYTAKELRDVLERAGFQIQTTTYWNMLLFPFVVAWRRIRRPPRRGAAPTSDLWQLPRWLNGLLTGLITKEVRFASRIPLPFGVSIMGVAKKVASGESPVSRSGNRCGGDRKKKRQPEDRP